VSSGTGGTGAGMGTLSHRACQLQSGDCGSTCSCSGALDALCHVLLVASLSLILGPRIIEFRPSMVGFRGLCQRKPMYLMLFNFGLRYVLEFLII